jgi:predicted TIM-barrel fold metal-dependent hydrolase
MSPNKLPALACDTHVHVFRPDKYPYARDRAYTPGRVTAASLSRFLDRHGLERVVVVQPSVYGTDNRTLVDALGELGSKRARGIAMIDPAKVSDRALADLDAAGVVGVRLNLTTRDRGDLAGAVRAANRRLAGSDWHIQIYAPLPAITAATGALSRTRRTLVLDHFGGAGMGQPDLDDGMRALTRLAAGGPAYIKLSGAYRVCTNPRRRWRETAPLAAALIDAVPDRLVWGSDWPHTGGHDRKPSARLKVEPFQRIDDRIALEQLALWAGSRTMLSRILVENPARLYGFR